MNTNRPPTDEARIQSDIHRLLAQYPETSNGVWIAVIVVGFLLVIPIAFIVMALALYAKLNPALGFVGGMALWLGVFMFLRQCLIWVRESKVGACVDAFNQAWPSGPLRESVLHALRSMKDDENPVLERLQERLGIRRSGPAVLAAGGDWNAGAGLAGAADPQIDREVEGDLRSLETKLWFLGRFQTLIGLGLPLGFFVLVSIYEPKEKPGSVIWGSLIVLVVWYLITAFVMGMIESVFLSPAAERFNRRFPAGGSERPVALAAFSRIAGCNRAKARMRAWLRDNEEPDDEDDAEEGQDAKSQGVRAKTGEPQIEHAPAAQPRQPRAVDVPLEPMTAGAARPAASRGGAAPIMLEPFAAQAPVPMHAPSAPLAPARAQIPAVPVRQFCSECGQRLKVPDSVYCSHCGERQV